MASNGPHIMKCLQENLDMFNDPKNRTQQNIALYNLSNALVGMYEDVQEEFRRLNARLTTLEQRLQR